jgi:hypothetical protein
VSTTTTKNDSKSQQQQKPGQSRMSKRINLGNVSTTNSTMSNSNCNSKKRQRWKGSFEYQVDYNDHFETPLVAYQDILLLLDGLNPRRKRQDHVLYDPYYCNGRTATLFQQLGFKKVVHAKRDFYKDISNQQVPQHDTLVTNPPYSDTHKEKCLEFCVRQFQQDKRPFFLLMPNYVAARSYCRRILGASVDDVAYLIPSTPYEYDHPEGTGHEISPFASLWFCGIGKDKINELKDLWVKHEAKTDTDCPKFVASLDELGKLRAIPTEKRPNPRQRKKRRANKAREDNPLANDTQGPGKAKPTESTVMKAMQAKKAGRHRDETGKRTKKRF